MELEKEQLHENILASRQETLKYWNSYNNLSYLGWPVFHFSDFKLTEEVETLFRRKQPQVVVFENVFDLENLSDFEITEEHIKTIITFDEIKENQDITDSDFELWMSEDIKCGLNLINDTVFNNAFIIYFEGEGDFAPLWKNTLIEILKEK